MQCPACGNMNRAGVKFCAKCGKPLPQQPAEAATPQTPAYSPPPAPPAPAQIPPVAPAAKPSPAARTLPWKNIAIGCAIYLLGMICGALLLAGVLYGVEWSKVAAPFAPASPAWITPAAPPFAPTTKP